MNALKRRVKHLMFLTIMLFYRKRVELMADWLSYEMGFTGNGPSSFDVKPSEPRPKLPKFIVRDLTRAAEEDAAWRRECWRQSVGQVTGEWDSLDNPPS